MVLTGCAVWVSRYRLHLCSVSPGNYHCVIQDCGVGLVWSISFPHGLTLLFFVKVSLSHLSYREVGDQPLRADLYEGAGEWTVWSGEAGQVASPVQSSHQSYSGRCHVRGGFYRGSKSHDVSCFLSLSLLLLHIWVFGLHV